MKRADYQQGFTLLEILLVVALMAIVSTAVVLTVMPNDPQRQLEREAQRFAAVMNMAAEQAVMTGTEYGVVTTEAGYHFVRYGKGAWHKVEKDKLLRAYTLPDNIVLTLTVDDLPWQQDKDQLFNDDALFEENVGDIDKEEQQQLLPQVFIYSYGEFMPFTATFALASRTADIPDYEVKGELDRAKVYVFGEPL